MSGHHHHHHATGNLKLAFFLNLAFTVFEIFGGLYVNSIAIISDAVHDLGDSLSLGTAWYLQKKSEQKPDRKYSFGYARFSLLGALINALVLITGSIYVISEAVGRMFEPQSTDAKGMFFFALVGIAVNSYAAWKVSSGKSMNERLISWHLIEDVLGWTAILIGSIILLFKDLPYLDPALSLLITLYILWNVLKSLKETLFIFLQGIPEDVDPAIIEEKIIALDSVDSVHHTRVWSLEGQHHVFTTHVKLGRINSMSELLEVKENIKHILSEYPFKFYTIETELDRESCGLPPNGSHEH